MYRCGCVTTGHFKEGKMPGPARLDSADVAPKSPRLTAISATDRLTSVNCFLFPLERIPPLRRRLRTASSGGIDTAIALGVPCWQGGSWFSLLTLGLCVLVPKRHGLSCSSTYLFFYV